MSVLHRSMTSLIALLASATALSAQSLDRNVTPTPGQTPALMIPQPTRLTLSNGAELVVVEKHDLPLIAFSISWIGGSDNFDPPGKLGLATLTARMVRTEGTTTRTADQVSNAQQLLGTSIVGGIVGESGTIGFFALKNQFTPALDLLADVMLHPVFPAASLDRIRGQMLVQLAVSRDDPNYIAGLVFAKTLYGDDHPYSGILTEATLNAITRDDLVALHKAYYRPGGAIITVAGDIDPATARAAVEKAFAGWARGGAPSAFNYPAPPAPKPTTIYLVDKKEAAQSVFHIGLPGPARSTPDYYAIEVMNQILGVLFQSRLNHNIREEKGYSYGVSSSFRYGRGPGPFDAGGGIVTAKTDSALIEFMKELQGVQGGKPFTQDEITQGKTSLIQSLPDRFNSVRAVAGSFTSLYTDGVPDSFYRDFAANINAVTADDLVRVARKYIDLNHLTIVIVGDRAVIEEPLRKTGIAPIVILDTNGKRIGIP